MKSDASRFVLVLLVIALAVVSAACAPLSLVGTDDVELTYETESAPAPARFGEDLRALVLRRLVAAHIGADVIEDGRRIRIVVDERLAPSVDELVTWSGTLLLFEPDPSYAPMPREPRDLTMREDRHPDGLVERFWEGSHAAVTRAVAEWPVDREHRLVAEPIWSTDQPGEKPRWRTRAVRTPPIGELGDGIFVGWGEGGMLRLRAAPKTPSENVLAVARARRAAVTTTPFRHDILARGRTSLGVPVLAEGAANVAFGTGVEAWARAQEEKLVLTTPRLPALRRVGSVGLPTNTVLATACFFVPIVLSLAWLLFVRRFDRAHPEPVWLIVATFVLGALAPVLAGVIELLLTRLSPWLDPHVVTFGGQVFALPLSFVVFTLVVGLPEEGSKLLATIFAARRREFDEPIDGIVYGIVASLGFAAAENVQYFALARLTAPAVIARCFMSVPAHMFFGAIWGYALGARLVDRRIRMGAYLLAAAAIHGLFDALLSADGLSTLAVLLNLTLASVFVVLVRRALRHGVVEEAALAIRPEERRMFRVGRPVLFALSAVAVHLLALGIFMLGAWWQLSRHRPGLTFVLGSSIMLGLLAVAAFGVSATVPLDVVIDDYGVTFAGAARRWSKIRGFDVHDDHVMLECEGGPIRLGPGTRDAARAIAEALGEHVGGGGRATTLESTTS